MPVFIENISGSVFFGHDKKWGMANAYKHLDIHRRFCHHVRKHITDKEKRCIHAGWRPKSRAVGIVGAEYTVQ